MTDKIRSRSDFTPFDGRVGQAYSQHIQGQNEAAIESFLRLIDEWADHVDSNYGLALSYRAAGQTEKAAAAFRRTRQIVQSEMSKTAGDSAKFQMLMRMIDQHVAYLENQVPRPTA